MPDAKPGECFHNVRRCIEKSDGAEVFGWEIWSWPGVYVEATCGSGREVKKCCGMEKAILGRVAPSYVRWPLAEEF